MTEPAAPPALLSELAAAADAAVDAVIPTLRAADDRGAGVATKSSTTDMVTRYDRWCETTLVDTLRSLRPADGFLGEEGADDPGTSGVVWVIDPIDGTTNFLYDLPGYSVSVGATVRGAAAVGVVHDPIRDERFRAVAGNGATRNGHPIAVGDPDTVATALLATGFSYDPARRRAQAGVLVEVLPQVRDIRRFGGAALDLCAVACGRVDAYYERGLAPWDLAAGALIASEAGAVVDDRSAAGGALLAAAPSIADELGAVLDAAGAHHA